MTHLFDSVLCSIKIRERVYLKVTLAVQDPSERDGIMVACVWEVVLQVMSQIMTVGESRNAGKPVNQQLCFWLRSLFSNALLQHQPHAPPFSD